MKQGFTLIEIMIAVAIFSIMLLVLSSVFSQFVFTERRDIAELALQQDVRLALEQFTREARTGYGSSFSNGTTGDPAQTITFRNQNNNCVDYTLDKGVWKRAETSTAASCDSADYANFVSLTSSQTAISTLHFLLPGGVVRGGQLASQGFVTVIVDARSATNASSLPLHIQTTIASRQMQTYEQTPP